jgi:TorA maturation chaperone TorD
MNQPLLNSSFDWNGIRAPCVFADVRTDWSPAALERVTKHEKHPFFSVLWPVEQWRLPYMHLCKQEPGSPPWATF